MKLQIKLLFLFFEVIIQCGSESEMFELVGTLKKNIVKTTNTLIYWFQNRKQLSGDFLLLFPSEKKL